MTTLASLMVRLTAGTPDDALLMLAADLAARLKVTKVIGISAHSRSRSMAVPRCTCRRSS